MTATLQSATLDDMASKKSRASTPELETARELVRQAREQGLSLTGPDGLLKQMTKMVLEPAARSEASQYGQFVLAAVGLLIVIAGSRKKTLDSASARYAEAQIEQLTTILRDQWTRAAQERGLLEPRLPIRWRGPTGQVAVPVSAALESRETPGRFPALPQKQRIDSVAQLHSGGRKQLHDVYGGLASGRLILVGAPGSGKSSAAILLSLDALKSRQEAGAEDRLRIPVPVILTMHGWDPRTTPVTDWVAGELVRTHQLIRHADHAAAMLRDDRLSVFFDGLDEISEHLRPHALKALNEAPFRLVLLTRTEEAAAAAAEAPLDGAVALELQPVTPEIAGEYLLHGLVDPAPRAWRALADHLTAAPSGPVAQALDNPLRLSLVRQVYKSLDPVDELLDTTRPTLAEIEDHLLGRLVMMAYTPAIGSPLRATALRSRTARCVTSPHGSPRRAPVTYAGGESTGYRIMPLDRPPCGSSPGSRSRLDW